MAGNLIKTFRDTVARIAEIEQQIALEQSELAALRGEVDELRALLGAVVHPQDEEQQVLPGTTTRKRPIRGGSTVGHAKRVLQMYGAPLHVNDIIINIQHMTGLSVSKATLVSNLARYVKNDDTFTREGANTFGLKDYSREDLDRGIRLAG